MVAGRVIRQRHIKKTRKTAKIISVSLRIWLTILSVLFLRRETGSAKRSALFYHCCATCSIVCEK